MSLTKKFGMIILSGWLILTGLMAMVPALHAIPPVVMSVGAIAAGVLILIER